MGSEWREFALTHVDFRLSYTTGNANVKENTQEFQMIIIYSLERLDLSVSLFFGYVGFMICRIRFHETENVVSVR